jgi:hypothetical protein
MVTQLPNGPNNPVGFVGPFSSKTFELELAFWSINVTHHCTGFSLLTPPRTN